MHANTGSSLVSCSKGERERFPTSADPLLLSRQNAGGVDDADALQDGVGQLGTHEPAGGGGGGGGVGVRDAVNHAPDTRWAHTARVLCPR